MYGDAPQVRGGGGVIWRRTGDGRIEVVLVHHGLHHDWALPKGKQDSGEDIAECAVREIWEETGLHCMADHPLIAVHYTDRIGRTKAVHYWSMHAGDDEELHVLKPSMEIDDATWIPLADSLSGVDLARDRLVLWTFAGRMGMTHDGLGQDNSLVGKLLTKRAPCLLVRHASAGDRYGDGEDDSQRPLDSKGVAQSAALAARLASFPVAKIVASPAVRCVQTVEPLAAALGIPVETDTCLGEGRAGEAGGVPAGLAPGTVVCTHGDIAEAILRSVASVGALPLPGDGAVKKASAWILDNSDHINGNGNGKSKGKGNGKSDQPVAPFTIAGYLAPPGV